MQMAYSFSNTIIYFKNKGKNNNELENLKKYMIEEMKEATFNNEFDTNTLRIFIEEFVNRNKYVDFKYVN